MTFASKYTRRLFVDWPVLHVGILHLHSFVLSRLQHGKKPKGSLGVWWTLIRTLQRDIAAIRVKGATKELFLSQVFVQCG